MQTWHHVLRKPQPRINEIKHLRGRSPFYCSSRVRLSGNDRTSLSMCADVIFGKDRLQETKSPLAPALRERKLRNLPHSIAVELEAQPRRVRQGQPAVPAIGQTSIDLL